MDPLANIPNELEALQSGVDSLKVSLPEIQQDLEKSHSSSKELISRVLESLNVITVSLPEQRRALDRVSHEINQVKGQIRELRARAKMIGGTKFLSREKEKLVELRHICQDLKSDVEAIGSFELNFRSRLARLRNE